MATYKGQPVAVGHTGTEIAEKFSDLRNFEEKINALPAEQREKLNGLTFEKDAVSFDVNMVGHVTFRIQELGEERIRMQSEGTPMPLTLSLEMKNLSGQSTQITPTAELEIPFMLKAMVGPHIQKAMDQIGGLIATLAKS